MKKTAGYYRGAMEALDKVDDYLRDAYEAAEKAEDGRDAVPRYVAKQEALDDIEGAVECIYTDYNVENAKRLGDWPTE